MVKAREKNFQFHLLWKEKHFLKLNDDLKSFGMNSETSCIAKGRLTIIVGGKNVLHLIANVWQNIRKNNRENRHGRREVAIDQLLCFILG